MVHILPLVGNNTSGVVCAVRRSLHQLDRVIFESKHSVDVRGDKDPYLFRGRGVWILEA